VTWAEPGLLRVRRRVVVRRGEMGTDATGPYWVFAVVRAEEGGPQYLHGAGRVAAPGRRFAIFMPPWSIVLAAAGAGANAGAAVAPSWAPPFSSPWAHAPGSSTSES